MPVPEPAFDTQKLAHRKLRACESEKWKTYFHHTSGSGPGKAVDVPVQRMGQLLKFIYARDP